VDEPTWPVVTTGAFAVADAPVWTVAAGTTDDIAGSGARAEILLDDPEVRPIAVLERPSIINAEWSPP